MLSTGYPQEGGAAGKQLTPAQQPQQQLAPFSACDAAANPAAALVNELMGGLGGGALGFPALPILPPLQLQQLTYNAIECQDGLHFTFDAPGVKKEDITITVLPPAAEGGRASLFVRTCRGGESRSGDWNTFREERCVGARAGGRAVPPPLSPPRPLPPSPPPLPPAPSRPPLPRSWSGKASRTIPLPAYVDADKVRVEGLNHGVLSITCPRSASAGAHPAARRLTSA